MLKRFFSVFVFVLISSLSFFLSTLAVKYIKSLDPIMVKIEENKNNYEVQFSNAVINDDSIIPGKSGVSIDIDSSYNLMKKYGSYNENLFVYKAISPNVSISEIYDKYILSGNPDYNRVSFIFKIENVNNLKEIVYILKEKDVIGTFFINDNILFNNKEMISFLYLNNQEIESLGKDNSYKYLDLKNTNIYIKNYISKNLSYCYSDNHNKDVLNVCSVRRMHTIIPSVNTDKYPFTDIKNNLFNGAIIKFNSNSRVVHELRHIINYIRQKNYEIVSLKKLLEE